MVKEHKNLYRKSLMPLMSKYLVNSHILIILLGRMNNTCQQRTPGTIKKKNA